MLSPDVPEFKPRYMEEPVSTYQEPETPHHPWEQNFQATSAPYENYLLSGGGYGGDFAAHYIPHSFSPLHLPPSASHGPHPVGPYSEGVPVNQSYQNIMYEVSDSCASWSPTHQNVSGFHQRGIYSPWKQKKYHGDGNLHTRSGQQKNGNNHKKYIGKKMSKSYESGDRNVESSSMSEVKKSVKWSTKEHSDQYLTKKSSETLGLVVTEECWPSLNPRDKTSSEKHFPTNKATVIESGYSIESDKVWSKTFSEAFKGSAPSQFFPKEASPDDNEPGRKEEGQNRNVNSLKKKKLQKSSKLGSKSKKDNVVKSGKNMGLKKDRFSESDFKKKEKQPNQNDFKKKEKQPNQDFHRHSSNSSRSYDGQQNVSGKSLVTVYNGKPAEFVGVSKERSNNTGSKPLEKIVKKEAGNKKEESQVKETMAERIVKSLGSKTLLENTSEKTVNTKESESTNLTLECNEEYVKGSHILNSSQICKAVSEWQIVKSEKKKKNAISRDASKGEREKGNDIYIHERKTEDRFKVEKRGQGSRIHAKERDEKPKEVDKSTAVRKSNQNLNKSVKRWNQANEANKENGGHLKRYGGSGVKVKQRPELETSQNANTSAKDITEPQVSVWSNSVDKSRETGARPKTGSFIEQQKLVRKPSLSPFKDVRKTKSSSGDMPNLLDKTLDKCLEDGAKKKRRMEEKRKKRESKARLAMELANKDVRITIVTKERVESLMSNKGSVKNVQKYNIAIEDYPAIEHFPSLNTSKSKTSESLPSVSKCSKRAPKLQNVVDVINDPEWENIEEPTPVRNEEPVEPISLSYSLALKAVSKKPLPSPAATISKVKKTGKEKKEAKPPPNQPKKKVKTKDLIQFNILSILERSKKQQQMKMESKASQAKTSMQKSAPTVTVGGMVRTKRGKERENKRRKVTSLRKRLLREQMLNSRDLMLVLKEYAKNSSNLQEIAKDEICEASGKKCSVEKNETREEEAKESKSTPIGAQALEESKSSVTNPPENIDIEALRTILLKDIKSRESSFHNRKFREYCNQLVTPEINKAVSDMIEILVKFQERHYQRDPVKARIRRRYVCGLRETTKLMNKMSCIILVPDIRRSAIEGSLDDQVKKLINKATECEVPVVFAQSRRNLGFLLHKRAGVSCMGIINFQGAQDAFNHVMELVPVARAQYHKMISLPGRQPKEEDDREDEEGEDGRIHKGEETEGNESPENRHGASDGEDFQNS